MYFPIKNGDIPASYVSLPEGITFSLQRYGGVHRFFGSKFYRYFKRDDNEDFVVLANRSHQHPQEIAGLIKGLLTIGFP